MKLEGRKNLIKLMEMITGKQEYSIPAVWNGFNVDCRKSRRKGDIIADADFYRATILAVLEKPDMGFDDLASGAPVYAMLPRSYTAYDTAGDGVITPGTFLRAISLLPHIKALGAGAIYMLPLALTGEAYKKGGAGSPYAVKDYARLDPSLHDDMAGEYCSEKADIEFAAFVEACHIFGIRVLVDFVFRTCARDSELIRRHPDWFYWIGKDNLGNFMPPGPKDGSPERIDIKNAHKAYLSPYIDKYLAAFRTDPGKSEEWASIVNAPNLLEKIEKEFNITTAPAFPDVFNDTQPAWGDVTYLRYDLDASEVAKKYIPPHQPPFILYDAIKLSIFEAGQPNCDLWDYISKIIPDYISRYGIDGARLDMAHALPPQLLLSIIEKAREKKRDFIFWSEGFTKEDAISAARDGFDFVSGSIWDMLYDIDRDFMSRLFSDIMASPIPLSAALELPDTPRAAMAHGSKERICALYVFTALLPNVISVINSGIELMERQPMNLGLGDHLGYEKALEPDDAMYGKLAFFDIYRLHWHAFDRDICSAITAASRLRKKYSGIISRDSIIKNGSGDMSGGVTAYAYAKDGKGLYVALNAGKTAAKVDMANLVSVSSGKVVYSNMGRRQIDGEITLKPDEAVAIEYFYN
ncbi:MAG: hypothetical protein ACOYJD_06265 [Christensenellales bacterium]|jgi:starch synthase (maltosyl-transferring)